MQNIYETLSLARKHEPMATIPKQKPSHRFGKLVCPNGERKLAKVKARQKYCS
jgi:hypothetical protein